MPDDGKGEAVPPEASAPVEGLAGGPGPTPPGFDDGTPQPKPPRVEGEDPPAPPPPADEEREVERRASPGGGAARGDPEEPDPS